MDVWIFLKKREAEKGQEKPQLIHANNRRFYICKKHNPYQLKEASVREAKPTPPTMGIRDNTTHIVGICTDVN